MRWMILVTLLTALPAFAQGTSELERIDKTYRQESVLPQPDAAGEYSRSAVMAHPFWEVVAEGGLNGRSGTGDPANVAEWPVVAVFPQGTVLTATAGPRTQSGILAVFDRKEQSWLRVHLPGTTADATCYVRAHKKYIRPVRVSEE